MKPIVVVPAAGKSSRFLGDSPKWMRTHPDGSLMIEKALKTFEAFDFQIYIITTKEINQNFKILEKLGQAIPSVKLILLENATSSSIGTFTS